MLLEVGSLEPPASAGHGTGLGCPTGSERIHEIKHNGHRLMARRDPAGIRLATKYAHD
jgi:hypothetical protein